MSRRVTQIVALAILLPLALVAGFLTYIGYWGATVYRAYPAVGARQADEAAVVLSGDMGLKIGMGPKLVAALTAHGVPVLGLDSLAAFKTERTPQQVEQVVAEAVRRAVAMTRSGRVVLIGQSFGADMLHVGLAALPPAARAHVRLVALLVPSDTVAFKASPGEFLTLNQPLLPALPTARLLDWVPVLCVHGAEETTSLCPQLRGGNVHQVALPGGHYLHHDAQPLLAVLTAAIRQGARS